MTNQLSNQSKVAVIMGSQSDYPVMIEAIKALESFSIPVHTQIISAHRTPELMVKFAKEAQSNGFQVIIAGAGGAAHLPGMVASLTTLPVIGVPIESKNLKGIDSLYSIVQMPPGIPVATMAINGAKNAGLFAVQILALSDENLAGRIQEFRENQTRTVLDNSQPKL